VCVCVREFLLGAVESEVIYIYVYANICVHDCAPEPEADDRYTLQIRHIYVTYTYHIHVTRHKYNICITYTSHVIHIYYI